MDRDVPLPFSAVILNGGSARRFGGIDKQCIEIQGIPAGLLLARQLCMVSDDVIIAGRMHSMYQGLPVRQIQDKQHSGGPAEGLRSGMEAARHEWVLLCAVDMPFFDPQLVSGMLSRISCDDTSIIACVLGGQLQPFEALYRTNLRAALTRYLEQEGSHSLRRFMDMHRLSVIEEDEVDRLSPGRFPFINLNDPESVGDALRVIRRNRSHFDRLFSAFRL